MKMWKKQAYEFVFDRKEHMLYNVKSGVVGSYSLDYFCCNDDLGEIIIKESIQLIEPADFITINIDLNGDNNGNE